MNNNISEKNNDVNNNSSINSNYKFDEIEKNKFVFELLNRSYIFKENLDFKNSLSYKIALGGDVYGNIQRIDNALEGMKPKQDVCKQNLAELEKQFETAKVECKKEFPQEAELAEKSAEGV